MQQQCERIGTQPQIDDSLGVWKGEAGFGEDRCRCYEIEAEEGPAQVVMIVDDDPMARRLTSKALRKSGFKVSEASSGPEAIELFGREKPEMVLLDVVMPGMDGFETCRALRSESNGTGMVPILMVTGADDLDSINRAYEAGATDFITKPINWLILTQRIRYILRAGRTMAELQASRSASKQAELFEMDRNRVLEMIVGDHSLREITAEIARLVKRQKPQMHCGLFLRRKEQLHLSAATPGFPKPLLDVLETQQIGSNSSCSAAAAHLGHRVIASDIHASPAWELYRKAAIESVVRSSCSVPIFSGTGMTLGALSLMSALSFHPSRDDMKLLDTASKLAAVGIERRRLSEQLAHQARHDALTGLPNRACLEEFMQRFTSHVSNTHRMAVLFIDLDRFKHVNDSHGHSTGDLLLKRVAERLKECTRECDLLARMGGDEFLIVLNGIESREVAGRIASRILELIKAPFALNGHIFHLGASIGVSVLPEDGTDLEVLQKHADIAMYHAKNRGGSQFQFFLPKMNALLAERMDIENELRKALERGVLELYYQPLFTIGTMRIHGVEALLRWNHPDLGQIPPLKFIPIAEECGLIHRVGEWVLTRACRQNAQWQRKGYGPFAVSVNVSAVELGRADFLASIRRALESSGLQPQWLQIEITESALMENIDATIQKLETIRSLGVTIAIDDFGTGYSSMAYLQRLPLDCLKIDKSFIKDLDGAEEQSLRSRALIRAMIGMARNLGLKTVAEGIESRLQHDLLEAMGCQIGQGYLFKEPVSAKEIELICADSLKETVADILYP